MADEPAAEPTTRAATPEPAQLRALVEALLFVSDGPVAPGALARTLDVTPRRIELTLDALEGALEGHGMQLQRGPEGVQLVTAPEAAELVEQFLGLESARRLSTAALETLAVIAYRQPVTRAAIEAIRGTSSDHVLATLRARGLIERVGRAAGPGRPSLYGTTQRFLEHFGLLRASELPGLDEFAERLGVAPPAEQAGLLDGQTAAEGGAEPPGDGATSESDEPPDGEATAPRPDDDATAPAATSDLDGPADDAATAPAATSEFDGPADDAATAPAATSEFDGPADDAATAPAATSESDGPADDAATAPAAISEFDGPADEDGAAPAATSESDGPADDAATAPAATSDLDGPADDAATAPAATSEFDGPADDAATAPAATSEFDGPADDAATAPAATSESDGPADDAATAPAATSEFDGPADEDGAASAATSESDEPASPRQPSLGL